MLGILDPFSELWSDHWFSELNCEWMNHSGWFTEPKQLINWNDLIQKND